MAFIRISTTSPRISPGSPVSVVRSGPWKLLKFYEGNRVELYNLDEDIGETRNLARQRPETRERLLERLNGWLDRTEAPLPKSKTD